MAGRHEFNEVFFEDVRVPASQRVGEENRGWYHVAVGLDFERSSIGAVSGARRDLDDLLAFVREGSRAGRPLRGDPSVRQILADLAVSVQVGRMAAYNVAWMQNAGGVPNREANATKLYMSELQQRMQSSALRLAGLVGTLYPGQPGAVMQGSLSYRVMRSVAHTIEGGTSEIQRNVIATRGLGLPRASRTAMHCAHRPRASPARTAAGCRYSPTPPYAATPLGRDTPRRRDVGIPQRGGDGAAGSKIWPCGDRGVGARGARRLGQYARGGLPSQDAQYDDPG